MTIIAAILLLLLPAIAIISATRIVRTPLPWNMRITFLTLRLLLLALIAIAFIEPVMVFEQVQANRGPVPVLIDASKSMRLFLGDSTIFRSLTRLEEWNDAHPDKKQKFIFYTFGDSLAPLKKTVRSIQWSNRHSFLPGSMKAPVLRHSNAMLLISDGNWSNASLPAAAFSDKNVYYLQLKAGIKRPYLQLLLPDFPAVSTVDSPLVAGVVVEGVSSCNDNAIELSLFEGNKELEKRNLPIPSLGFFKNEVRIALKNVQPGRHMYRFEARSVRDTLNACYYALHSKLPKQFFYALYNTRPTLNRRFIQIALKRQRFFTESGPGSGTARNPDLIVLFDWDRNARQLMSNLKPGGTALFIGCLPCTSASVLTVSRSQVLRPAYATVSGSLFDDLDINKLPPPQGISICKSLPVLPQNVFLTAAVQVQGRPAPDTVNLFFTGRFENRNFIACTANEIWRWDFLPLAVEPDEGHVFAFSERLIAFSKEMLVNALSEALYLYPDGPPTESDSLRFRIVLPVGLPVPADIRLSCKFTSIKHDAFDTAFVLNSTGASNQTVLFRPLPAGDYKIEAFAVSKSRRYMFADSVFIEDDRSEYLVNGQNVSLLQEVAQPLPDFSESSLKTLFFPRVSEVNQSVKKTIHMNRNWPLLMLIFGIFSVEWILRRVLKLD